MRPTSAVVRSRLRCVLRRDTPAAPTTSEKRSHDDVYACAQVLTGVYGCTHSVAQPRNAAIIVDVVRFAVGSTWSREG